MRRLELDPHHPPPELSGALFRRRPAAARAVRGGREPYQLDGWGSGGHQVGRGAAPSTSWYPRSVVHSTQVHVRHIPQ